MNTAVTNPETYRLVWLDPRQLADHPLNVRHDLGDVTQLAGSIKASGIVEPLVVVPVEGGHRLVAGHRRNLASVQAGVELVPCIERADWADRDEEQIVAMIAENVHREAISAHEEADAYVQLAAFPGWSAEEISRRTGRSVERVRTAIAAASLPTDVRSHVVTGTLTLEQVAEIEAFADDPTATARLMGAAGRTSFHYALAEEHRKRARRQQLVELREQIKASGVRVVSQPKRWPYSSVEVPLDRLRTAAGKRITEKAHRTCPGHAVFIDADRIQAVALCTAPKDHGHHVDGRYDHLSEEEAATQAARDEAERQRTEALGIAAQARIAWMRDYITTAQPPTGLLRRLVELLVLHSVEDDELFLSLTTKRPGNDEWGQIVARLIRRTADNRLVMLLLGYVGSAAEANIARGVRGARWNYGNYEPQFTLAWFDLLAFLGYPITEHEQSFRDETAAAIAADEHGAEVIELGAVTDAIDDASETGETAGDKPVEHGTTG